MCGRTPPPARRNAGPAPHESITRRVKGTAVHYIRDGAEIYRRSFAMIRNESDLARFDPVLERTVVRMIHACGMTDLAADVDASPGFAAAAETALKNGKPILCDTNMVASGVTRSRLPADNEVICTLSEARSDGTNTRTALAVELWPLEGAVAVIGNAPTALFHLLDLVANGAPRPAAVIGVPVGFIGAAESKDALAESDLEYLVVRGRRGGSAIACGAINALASEAE
ncbi:MAG: precorrin-8X methylmutase [Solirubrobacterales bacterium]|nr:precorrin-8X methylmutase [Solirubrobacterales bacterium]